MGFLKHCHACQEVDGAQARIKRRDGQEFVITPAKAKGSPLDVPGVRLHLTAAEIVRAVREGREREPAGASIRVPGRAPAARRAPMPKAPRRP